MELYFVYSSREKEEQDTQNFTLASRKDGRDPNDPGPAAGVDSSCGRWGSRSSRSSCGSLSSWKTGGLPIGKGQIEEIQKVHRLGGGGRVKDEGSTADDQRSEEQFHPKLCRT